MSQESITTHEHHSYVSHSYQLSERDISQGNGTTLIPIQWKCLPKTLQPIQMNFSPHRANDKSCFPYWFMKIDIQCQSIKCSKLSCLFKQMLSLYIFLDATTNDQSLIILTSCQIEEKILRGFRVSCVSISSQE